MSLVCHFLILSAVISPALSFNVQLCVNESVNVQPNSSGTIEYIHRDDQISACTLTLSGFTPASYISLSGIRLRQLGCSQNTPAITINNQQYCVENDPSSNMMIQTTDGTLPLNISAPGSKNFTIEFYSNGKYNSK